MTRSQVATRHSPYCATSLPPTPTVSPGPGLDPAVADIAVPLRLRHGETELSFISTKTTFGTAVDVTVSELSIESFFPADPQTTEAMRSLLGAEPEEEP